MLSPPDDMDSRPAIDFSNLIYEPMGRGQRRSSVPPQVGLEPQIQMGPPLQPIVGHATVINYPGMPAMGHAPVINYPNQHARMSLPPFQSFHGYDPYHLQMLPNSQVYPPQAYHQVYPHHLSAVLSPYGIPGPKSIEEIDLSSEEDEMVIPKKRSPAAHLAAVVTTSKAYTNAESMPITDADMIVKLQQKGYKISKQPAVCSVSVAEKLANKKSAELPKKKSAAPMISDIFDLEADLFADPIGNSMEQFISEPTPSSESSFELPKLDKNAGYQDKPRKTSSPLLPPLSPIFGSLTTSPFADFSPPPHSPSSPPSVPSQRQPLQLMALPHRDPRTAKNHAHIKLPVKPILVNRPSFPHYHSGGSSVKNDLYRSQSHHKVVTPEKVSSSSQNYRNYTPEKKISPSKSTSPVGDSYVSPLDNIYQDSGLKGRNLKISLQDYRMKRSQPLKPGAPPRPSSSSFSAFSASPQKVKSSTFTPASSATGTRPPNPPSFKDVMNKTNLEPKQKAPLNGTLQKKISYLPASSSQERAQTTSHPEKKISPKTTAIAKKLEAMHTSTMLKQGFSHPKFSYSQQRVPHNINDYFRFNTEDKTKCSVCKCSFKFITRHYKDKHPNHEVLISRISPSDLQLAEEEANLGVEPPLEGNYQCRLCSKKLPDLALVMDHATFHTGEYCYLCSKCNRRVAIKEELNNHWKKEHEAQCGRKVEFSRVQVFPKPVHPNKIPAYICPVCNWLQLDKVRVETHIKNEHGIDLYRDKSIKLKVINMVMHIPPEEVEEVAEVTPKRGRRKKEVDYKLYASALDDEPIKRKRKSNKAGEESGTDAPKTPSTLTSSQPNNFEDDDTPCLICGEPYNQTTKTTDWIQCVRCIRWLHSDCTAFENLCQTCGRGF